MGAKLPVHLQPDLAESGIAGLDWKTQGADIGLVNVRRSAKLIRVPLNVPAFE